MLDFLDVLETKRVDFHENELSHFCANRIFFGLDTTKWEIWGHSCRSQSGQV
jgi:hypothetical protein